ncbi:tumor protein p53-inducible protein 13 [Ambystoma mexicanum]|uniref:tumor protein p53-inducible protein 13 n=1 Tax=Ambystoma mexicanum TaxID=8296 RepID=UPI0037E7A80F
MHRPISCIISIPNRSSGPHRPRRACYGEFKFCPSQRWVNNLQQGAVAFLYHPCVDPRLKEELCLLARTHFEKHIITPHLCLSKERPLALASWTATLEMQQVNLTEALTWMRENTDRVAAHETEVGDYYDYLLTRPAVVKLSKSEKKWGIKQLNIHRSVVLKRRKRAMSLGAISSKGLQPVVPTQSSEEHNEGRSGNSEGVGYKSEMATTVALNKLTFRRIREAFVNVNASRKDDRVQLIDRKSPTLGGGQDSGSESAQSIPQQSERASIHLKEAMNDLPIPLEAENAKGISGEEEQRKSTFKEQGYAALATNATLQNIGGFENSVGKDMDTQINHNSTRENSQGSIPVTDNVPSFEMNNSALLPLPDNMGKENSSLEKAPNKQSSQKVGGFTANISEPLVGLRNITPSLVSSETSKDGNGNSSRQEQQGRSTEDVDTSTTNGNGQNDASVPKITDARNISTPPLGEVGKGRDDGSGKEQCTCPGASAKELFSHQNHQALAQVGIVGNVKHIEGEQAGPRAAVDTFVRTPRTEEAAWAAAALMFLFVLLTLAVLYTRLWRKFRKSQSLYWARSSDEEGQETVSAVIKRRLTVGQARRKKRQTYKKRPLIFYENVSDSSD